MRYVYCLFVVFSFCFADLAAAQYTAVITAELADVYSGPGSEFYVVRQLQAGDQVEVHYEQGDWLAIRPPIGCFSWVSAQYVNVGAGNIGTVRNEGLASRIGSDYSEDCDTVQITLKKGESILILDRKETPGNSASPIWLKIAPPSGEFRWIHRTALELNIPEPTGPVRQVQYDTMTLRIPELPKVTQPQTTPQPIPVPKIASAQPFTAKRKLTPQPLVQDPFQRAFAELQREAYAVMTRPTDDEIFAQLIQKAEELHQKALTEQDLEKTYHLLESLQRTRAVRKELVVRRPNTVPLSQKPSDTVNSSGTPVARQSIIPAYTPTSVQSGTEVLQAGVNIGGFDIVGRLGEFDPLPKGHPPFAVVDEKEQIICLISPSADLDLSQYVGQFVGINGILSYYEKPGKPRSRHLSAQNIRTVR